jgi:hypothetical protein
MEVSKLRAPLTAEYTSVNAEEVNGSRNFLAASIFSGFFARDVGLNGIVVFLKTIILK